MVLLQGAHKHLEGAQNHCLLSEVRTYIHTSCQHVQYMYLHTYVPTHVSCVGFRHTRMYVHAHICISGLYCIGLNACTIVLANMISCTHARKHTQTMNTYNRTCLVSTWISTHSWTVSTPPSVPVYDSCTVHKTTLI